VRTSLCKPTGPHPLDVSYRTAEEWNHTGDDEFGHVLRLNVVRSDGGGSLDSAEGREKDLLEDFRTQHSAVVEGDLG
jgi:hypothetical protein